MLDKTALTLTIIGALNWGSIGIFQFDIVAWLFGGQGAMLSRIVYTLVALAGIWCILRCFGILKPQELRSNSPQKKRPAMVRTLFSAVFDQEKLFNRSCQFTPIKGLSKVIPDFSERFHNLSKAFFPTRRINKADSHWNNGKSSPV